MRCSSVVVVIVPSMLATPAPACIVEASTIFGARLAAPLYAAYGRCVTELLLDRDAELDVLERRLTAIGSGAGRVVVVEGPAGIGKSSLLGAIGRSATAQGVTVVRARGGLVRAGRDLGHRAPAV